MQEWQQFNGTMRQSPALRERSQWSREWAKQLDKLDQSIREFQTRLDALWEALNGREQTAKTGDKEHKWVTNLDAFSKWLALVRKW